MTQHFQREIEKLKQRLFSLCTLVEDSVAQATHAIERRDTTLATAVIDGDVRIDQMEVDVEEECLKILALHQPVAIDLRFVVAVLKINNDLERIGDLAVNIAERALFLATRQDVHCPLNLTEMAERSQSMLRQSIDSLINMDCPLAERVCAADDEVDAMNRAMYEWVEAGIQQDVNSSEPFIHLLSASRHIERIADLATNIAEDVIYMARGEIARHRTEDYRRGNGAGTE